MWGQRFPIIFSKNVDYLKIAGTGGVTNLNDERAQEMLAQGGRKVILVDCDLRHPRQHEIFGVPAEPGLSNMILDKRDTAPLAPTGVENLLLLPAGLLMHECLQLGPACQGRVVYLTSVCLVYATLLGSLSFITHPVALGAWSFASGAAALRSSTFFESPRTFCFAGSPKAKFVTTESRKGTRASSEWAIEARSVFTSKSSTR